MISRMGGGQGILGIMPDFYLIDMEFGVKVEFDILNKFLKFRHD